MRGKVRDASWLIGPLLIIPAVLYLSFWSFENTDFLRHARKATASIAPYQWGLPKEERKHQYDVYATYIEFTDEGGQRIRGYLYDDLAAFGVGDSVDILYDTRWPDYRVAESVFVGLYLGLAAAALGLLLSLIAFTTSNRQVVETTPSYLDYWGGDDEYWSVKAKSELPPPERDVLD